MAVRLAALIVLMAAFACGPSEPSRADAAGSEPPIDGSSGGGGGGGGGDPDANSSQLPDGGGGEFNCGPSDAECEQDDYMSGCGADGKCLAAECCCPQSQQCRSGSFPFCCPSGEVCMDTATGQCG